MFRQFREKSKIRLAFIAAVELQIFLFPFNSYAIHETWCIDANTKYSDSSTPGIDRLLHSAATLASLARLMKQCQDIQGSVLCLEDAQTNNAELKKFLIN